MAVQVMDEPLMAPNGLFGGLHLRAPFAREYEVTLVERARAGDMHAWHELIMNTLRLILFRVRRFERNVFQWRIEFEDVMQHVYMCLWERWGELLASSCPQAWLKERAVHVVEEYVRDTKSFIRMPDCAVFATPVVKSLSEPVGEGDEQRTLADVVEAAPLHLGSEVGDHEALYRAIRELPLRQRQAVVTLHHLEMEIGEEWEWNAADAERLHRSHYLAKQRLRQVLAEAYPQYAGEYQRARVRPAYADIVVSKDQSQRLQQACNELEGGGKRVTARALSKKTGIGTQVAYAYLYHAEGRDGGR